MKIRIAQSADMDIVYKLTHDQYVKEGYCKPQSTGKLVHYPHLDYIPETIVFVAEDDNNQIIGTNSLTIDNPHKLHVDEDFPTEVAAVRNRSIIMNRNLAASWRIVTSPNARNSMKVILALIKGTIEEVCKQHTHELLFSFNPKHEKIYAKLLGLRTIARGECDAVNNAPGVLMYVDSRFLLNKWQQVCQRRKIPYNCDIRDVWWPTAYSSETTSYWILICEKIDTIKEWLTSIPLWFAYWFIKVYFKCYDRLPNNNK